MVSEPFRSNTRTSATMVSNKKRFENMETSIKCLSHIVQSLSLQMGNRSVANDEGGERRDRRRGRDDRALGIIDRDQGLRRFQRHGLDDALLGDGQREQQRGRNDHDQAGEGRYGLQQRLEGRDKHDDADYHSSARHEHHSGRTYQMVARENVGERVSPFATQQELFHRDGSESNLDYGEDGGPKYDDSDHDGEDEGPKYDDSDHDGEDEGPKYDDSDNDGEDDGPKYDDSDHDGEDGGSKYDEEKGEVVSEGVKYDEIEGESPVEEEIIESNQLTKEENNHTTSSWNALNNDEGGRWLKVHNRIGQFPLLLRVYSRADYFQLPGTQEKDVREIPTENGKLLDKMTRRGNRLSVCGRDFQILTLRTRFISKAGVMMRSHHHKDN